MILETFIIAVRSLNSNKLRTLLSMLGIIIGVGAVIAIVSIGTGSQQQITANISDLGSNVININQGWGRRLSSSSSDFTLEMAEYIEKTSPAVKMVMPNLEASGLLISGENDLRATIVGTEAYYQKLNKYYPSRGKFIDQSVIDNASDVIVLGSELVEELYANEDPLGQKIKFNYNGRTFVFTVIGVMEEKGRGIVGDLNDQAYIPMTTYLNKLANSNEVSGFIAQANSSEEATEAVEQIEYFMTKYLGDEDDFRIRSQDQILDTISSVTESMSLMLGGIAAISLVVGGIGIMNIMLVSVTERTSEIGIRKALGAKKKDILTQFLIESLCLSGIGGAIGVGIGYLAAYLISNIGDWPFVVNSSSVIIAFSFSLLIGIFFGIYPAMKAANLAPVDALNYE
ncbi:ABC transporter permease [Orenia marismortui]|uniref:Putative ABC transport system permease protein n=1 Tax=Orenia marismortui TaxID=46469 RepID=A0A4R8H350_9FIRM|nr:ABC transporter permease [Orenia marismortui]TDX53160.1 putative ABC transport system permease protein [Orenia marismortui]